MLRAGSAPGKVITTKSVNMRTPPSAPWVGRGGWSLPTVGLGRRRSRVGVTREGETATNKVATVGAGLGALAYRGGVEGVCEGAAEDRSRRFSGSVLQLAGGSAHCCQHP